MFPAWFGAILEKAGAYLANQGLQNFRGCVPKNWDHFITGFVKQIVYIGVIGLIFELHVYIKYSEYSKK